MDSIRRTIMLLTITLAFNATARTPAGFAQENSFRMPQYPDADPPPPRTREEIKKLLAGPDKAAQNQMNRLPRLARCPCRWT